MTNFRMVGDFFRQTPLRHWPGLFGYLFGVAVFRQWRIRLFQERTLVFRDFNVAVSVDGMNGLNFFHEIHFRGAYRLRDWAALADVRQVFDVGANCGYFTLEEAKQNPDWHFRCFEPHPRTFATLLRNLRGNGLTERVTASQVAIGSESGSCKMNISPDSSMAVAAGSPSEPVGSQIIEVPQLTLDEAAEQGGPFPDLIKIDVEGFEVSVLDGAPRCLERARFVIMEFHSEALREACLERLAAAGFQCRINDSLIFADRR